MKIATAILLLPALAYAQAAVYPVGSGRPSVEQARKEMGIPSTDEVRGQLDAVGYASTRQAMAKVWELAAQPPAPESLGPMPPPGVVGLIGPHDDYVYAARVDRRIYPLVTAKTVVLVGVFHRYRRFGARDQIIFDAHKRWRAPDGDIMVSPLRDELVAAMPPGEAVADGTAHDAEHSLEAIAYFLKHARADVEIVPLIVPAASFARLSALAGHLGDALARALRKRGWALGRDLAVVISTDGTHYGSDFQYTPYGLGGVGVYQQAVARDRALITDTLSVTPSTESAWKFFASVVNPDKPDEYKMPWCGRFAVPFGLMLLADVSKRMSVNLAALPLVLGVSVDTPQLKVDGIGATAPANLYHFVTQPGVAYVNAK